MKRKTKIVCTLGPSVSTKPMIEKLLKAGMNVARLNCSHGDWESKKEAIGWIREYSSDLAPCAILADLQGPKFRLGEVASGKITVAPGDKLTFGGTDGDLPVPSRQLMAGMQKGDRILLGDGNVELKLGEKEGDSFLARAVTGGEIKTKQGITVFGRSFDVPTLTTKDLQDIQSAVEAGADYIALSYVRSAADMRELRQIVDKLDPTIRLVCKVETKEALKDIDAIAKSSDVVMVARGDLGLQMDPEDVPIAQKRIINVCNKAAKPVITATQMLESMMENARPTRAEASDVANAILDGTDAVMLSGETAAGQYPIEAVTIMAKIAEKAESEFMVDPEIEKSHRLGTATDYVAQAAVEIACGLKCRAILTASTSGATPCMVSKYRPSMPILTACWNEKVQRQLAVSRGVFAALIDAPLNTDDAIRSTVNVFLRHKQVKVGDKVVVTAGVPVGQAGNTNLIEVITI